jgi:hypothetical protein
LVAFCTKQKAAHGIRIIATITSLMITPIIPPEKLGITNAKIATIAPAIKSIQSDSETIPISLIERIGRGLSSVVSLVPLKSVMLYILYIHVVFL